MASKAARPGDLLRAASISLAAAMVVREVTVVDRMVVRAVASSGKCPAPHVRHDR